MSTTLATGLLLLALGIFVWLFGNRMWLLGAGAGAMLGFGLLGLFPSLFQGWLGFFIILGLAIVLGVLGFLGKAFAKIIAMVIGFLAGGALVIGFLNLLVSGVTFWTWIGAVVGGLVGAVVFSRFVDWGLIIFAGLLGSMLVVRGAMSAIFPSLAGTLGSIIIVVLTVLGILYHGQKMK